MEHSRRVEALNVESPNAYNYACFSRSIYAHFLSLNHLKTTTPVMSEAEKDLEKCSQVCTPTYEEEGCQLLEDKPGGKIVYLFSYCFYSGGYVPGLAWIGIFISQAVELECFYFFARDYIYGENIEDEYDALSGIAYLFSTKWMIVNYVIITCYTLANCALFYFNQDVEIRRKQILQKLLEEVASSDLREGPDAWRTIAIRANQLVAQMGYRYDLFYGGKECLNYFVENIVKPVKSESYRIPTYDSEVEEAKFCDCPTNKNLVERAVANYDKSLESLGELSPATSEYEGSNSMFTTTLNFFHLTVPAFYVLQLGLMIIYSLMVLIVLLCGALWTAFSQISFKK